MKKIDKQNKNWADIPNTKDGIEYKEFVQRKGREYIEKRNKRNIFVKIGMFIFGDTDVLGEDLVNTYGEHNILNGKI